MRRSGRLALLFGAAVLLWGCRDAAPLVVGSKPFTESEIVGEMIAQLAEDLGARVERKFYVGGVVCFKSLQTGAMDIYVEYTGTGLVSLLNEPTMSDPDKVYARVKSEFARRWGLKWLKPLGFNNTYALVMRRAYAEKLGIAKMSELKSRNLKLRCGWDQVFYDRPDGYRGMIDFYDMDFCASTANMNSGLMYSALAAGQVDIISAYATDGRIHSLDLKPLADDLHFFPPYDAAPLARPAAFRKVPGLRRKLDALAGRLSDEEMMRLNAAVDSDDRSARDVAREFLASQGLIEPGEGETGGTARDFWGFFMRQRGEILDLSLEHIGMVGAAMLLGTLVGVPLGILLTRRRRLAPYILGAATIFQTMPSIALLGLLMLLPLVGGIGMRPAVTALFLYSLLAIVENTYIGIKQVHQPTVNAGRGMGMTDLQVLRMIELPQAMPVIIAGVRISAVVSVATATVASYIGAGGLGDLIFRGVARANNSMVLWGAIPAIVMSLVAHRILTWFERRLQSRAVPK